jgi:hypothetical protein
MMITDNIMSLRAGKAVSPTFVAQLQRLVSGVNLTSLDIAGYEKLLEDLKHQVGERERTVVNLAVALNYLRFKREGRDVPLAGSYPRQVQDAIAILAPSAESFMEIMLELSEDKLVMIASVTYLHYIVEGLVFSLQEERVASFSVGLEQGVGLFLGFIQSIADDFPKEFGRSSIIESTRHLVRSELFEKLQQIGTANLEAGHLWVNYLKAILNRDHTAVQHSIREILYHSPLLEDSLAFYSKAALKVSGEHLNQTTMIAIRPLCLQIGASLVV